MQIPTLSVTPQWMLVVLCTAGMVMTAGHPGSDSASCASGKVDREAIWMNEEAIRSSIGYPALARQSGIMGQVELDVLINEQGQIAGLSVENADHPLLEVACIEQLPYSRFRPAMQGGEPVASWKTLSFSFN